MFKSIVNSILTTILKPLLKNNSCQLTRIHTGGSRVFVFSHKPLTDLGLSWISPGFFRDTPESTEISPGFFNSFPTIIKIEKSYIQTTIFFIYFQKQTIGCMKLNSIYFMFMITLQKYIYSESYAKLY